MSDVRRQGRHVGVGLHIDQLAYLLESFIE